LRKRHGRKPITVGNAAIYRITVYGSMGADLSGELGGMQITQTRDDDGMDTTTLVGQVTDQGALLGILNALYSRRMPVLSVQCLEIMATQGTVLGEP